MDLDVELISARTSDRDGQRHCVILRSGGVITHNRREVAAYLRARLGLDESPRAIGAVL